MGVEELSAILPSRFTAQPAEQVTSLLPAEGAPNVGLFQVCSIVLACPKFLNSKGKEKALKLGLAIFVCKTTRALHLEWVTNCLKVFFFFPGDLLPGDSNHTRYDQTIQAHSTWQQRCYRFCGFLNPG